jgi:Flp pilus assembly pilin Flp
METMKLMKTNKKSGQGLVEYALILGLIAVVTAAVIVALGTSVSSNLSEVNVELGK